MPPVGPSREGQSMASPMWGPVDWGTPLHVYSLTASFDGGVVSVEGRPTGAGAQDLGLPSHVVRHRARADGGNLSEIWLAINDLTLEVLEHFRVDCRRLDREREQFVFAFPELAIDRTVHPRRLR